MQALVNVVYNRLQEERCAAFTNRAKHSVHQGSATEVSRWRQAQGSNALTCDSRDGHMARPLARGGADAACCCRICCARAAALRVLLLLHAACCREWRLRVRPRRDCGTEHLTLTLSVPTEL